MPEEKKQFWTTLPGILTGIATLIGAITGLIIALNSIPKKTTPTPEPPKVSSGIPIPGVKVAALQFYEGPYESEVEKTQRVYSTSFDSSTTRTIGWELDLEYPKPGRKIDFKIDAYWYNPDGSEMGRQSKDDAYVLADWTSSWDTMRWGWADPGHWKPGTYRLDLYVGDTRVASGTIEMKGTATGSAGGIPIPGVKVSALQFFEGPHDTTLEKSQRVYGSSFYGSATRSIWWELNLEYPKPGRKIDFKIDAFWYNPDGSEMGRQSKDDAVALADWTSSWYTKGWGWSDPGHWKPGTYRLNLYVGDTPVASGTFQIVAGP